MERVSVSGGHVRPAGGLELYAWLFMRMSGILLLVLALGHLAIMHLINSVDEIDFAFVAARYRNPAWRVYDWFLLVLALVHGMNGLRVLVDDYVARRGLRVFSQALVWVLTFAFLLVGSYVILTFQPPLEG